MTGYLENATGPVSLVVDLRITHERFGSSSDPSINGHLHYSNDVDRSLTETASDKIRKYRADYRNNPPNTISFMSGIASTSGRLPLPPSGVLLPAEIKDCQYSCEG